jgi:Raf kinase inhibitor-like YbhB/YbcL family protein
MRPPRHTIQRTVSPYPSGGAYDQQAMIRGFLRTARTAGFIAVASIMLAGCGFLNSGSTASPPPMTITSEAISVNILPSDFTCHSAEPQTPPLAWFGAPAGTQSYALVVDDSSAPITPYVYWIVFDISPGTTDIQQGRLPPQARQAQNSAGFAGYDPPCPQGHSHSYRFTIYALSKTLDLPAGTSLESAWMAIAGAYLDRGRMTSTWNP